MSAEIHAMIKECEDEVNSEIAQEAATGEEETPTQCDTMDEDQAPSPYDNMDEDEEALGNEDMEPG